KSEPPRRAVRPPAGPLPRPGRRKAAPESERDAVHAAVLARHDPLAQGRGRRATEARHRAVARGPVMPKPADLSGPGPPPPPRPPGPPPLSRRTCAAGRRTLSTRQTERILCVADLTA